MSESSGGAGVGGGNGGTAAGGGSVGLICVHCKKELSEPCESCEFCGKPPDQEDRSAKPRCFKCNIPLFTPKQGWCHGCGIQGPNRSTPTQWQSDPKPPPLPPSAQPQQPEPSGSGAVSSGAMAPAPHLPPQSLVKQHREGVEQAVLAQRAQQDEGKGPTRHEGAEPGGEGDNSGGGGGADKLGGGKHGDERGGGGEANRPGAGGGEDGRGDRDRPGPVDKGNAQQQAGASASLSPTEQRFQEGTPGGGMQVHHVPVQHGGQAAGNARFPRPIRPRVFGPPNQPAQHTPQSGGPLVGGPPNQPPQYAPQSEGPLVGSNQHPQHTPQSGGPRVVGPHKQTPRDQQVGSDAPPKSQLVTGLAPTSPLLVTQPDTRNTPSAASGPPPSECHPGTSQTEHSGASNVSSSQTQKPPGHSEGNLGRKPLHGTIPVQPSTEQTNTETDQSTASGNEFSVRIGSTPGPDNSNQAEAQARDKDTNVTSEDARNRKRSRGDHDTKPAESDRAKVLKSDGDSAKEPQITHPLQDTDVDSQKSQTQKDGPPKKPGAESKQSGDKSGAESSGGHGKSPSYADAAAGGQVSGSVLGMFRLPSIMNIL